MSAIYIFQKVKSSKLYVEIKKGEEIARIINKSFQRIFFDGQIELEKHEKKMIEEFKAYLIKNKLEISGWSKKKNNKTINLKILGGLIIF